MDYLNPEANKLFDQWTFDAYKQAIGDEMGKTVLGFRGDEPRRFGFNPWSPVLLAEFQKRKGYDLRPYLATVASISIGGRGRGAPRPQRQSRRGPPRLRRLLRRVVRSLRREFLRHWKANGAPRTMSRCRRTSSTRKSCRSSPSPTAISSSACAASRCPASTPSGTKSGTMSSPIFPSWPRRPRISTAIRARCARPLPPTIPRPTSRKPAGFSIT